MLYDSDDTLDKFHHHAFVGNIIPHSWYKTIRFAKSGKVDFVAIVLLAEIVFWYRPRDKAGGAMSTDKGFHKKFKGDALRYSLQQFEDKFGIDKRTVAGALKRLQHKGLILKERRTVNTGCRLMSNVLHLAPHADTILALDIGAGIISAEAGTEGAYLVKDGPAMTPLHDSKNGREHRPHTGVYAGNNQGNNKGNNRVDFMPPRCVPPTAQCSSSYIPVYELLPQDVGAHTSCGRTYTEITTKNTTKKAAASAAMTAAAFLTMSNEGMGIEKEMTIGPALTSSQQQCVIQRLHACAVRHPTGVVFKTHSLQAIESLLMADMLNPKRFTKAHGNFNHKLNALFAALQQGHWPTTPVEVRAPVLVPSPSHTHPDSLLQHPQSQCSQHPQRQRSQRLQALRFERDGFASGLAWITQQPGEQAAAIRSYVKRIQALDDEIAALSQTLSLPLSIAQTP